MADIKEDNQPYDEINITPMLDLAYVLLVIFIIMTTASVQGVKVETPHTTTNASLAKPQTHTITITAEGQMFLDAYPLDIATFESRLGQMISANPSSPLVLKGDAATQYDKVSDVLQLCKKLGVTEIGLVTKKLAE